MKFAYGIGTNDLLLKIKKIRELLADWYTIRVFVQLKWRENIYKDKIIEKFMFIQEALSDCAKSQTLSQNKIRTPIHSCLHHY